MDMVSSGTAYPTQQDLQVFLTLFKVAGSFGGWGFSAQQNETRRPAGGWAAGGRRAVRLGDTGAGGGGFSVEVDEGSFAPRAGTFGSHGGDADAAPSADGVTADEYFGVGPGDGGQGARMEGSGFSPKVAASISWKRAWGVGSTRAPRVVEGAPPSTWNPPGAAALQFQRIRAASGLRPGSRQDRSGHHRIPPHAALMVSRCSDPGSTVVAPGSESRCADRGKVFRAARKRTRRARVLPMDCPEGSGG